MKLKLIIIGAGGHGKACIDVVESTQQYTIEGIIDIPEKLGINVLGYTVIGSDDKLIKMIRKDRSFLIGIGQIGSPKKRKTLFGLLKDNRGNLPTVISPYAYVSRHARIGRGTIVMHNATINAGAVIGENCIINTNALVEHDAIIGNHCHVATAAVVNGDCILGSDVFIGSNTVLKNGISIEEGTILSAGKFIK